MYLVDSELRVRRVAYRARLAQGRGIAQRVRGCRLVVVARKTGRGRRRRWGHVAPWSHHAQQGVLQRQLFGRAHVAPLAIPQVTRESDVVEIVHRLAKPDDGEL